MKNVLVFGGFGFLGYYLLKELLSRGYDVVVADIKDDIEFQNKVHYINCDILKQDQVATGPVPGSIRGCRRESTHEEGD